MFTGIKKSRIKILFATLIVTAVFAFPMTVSADDYNGGEIVHKTENGHCYHRAECGYLWNSDERVTLRDAVITYKLDPCSKCNPPRYNGPIPTEQLEEKLPMPVTRSGGTSANQSSTGKSNSSTKSATSVGVRSYEKEDSRSYYIWGACVIAAVWIASKAILKAKDASKDKRDLPHEDMTNTGEELAKARKSQNLKLAYRTSTGNRYHLSPSCDALKGKTNIISYPIENARREWRKPCNLCAKAEWGAYKTQQGNPRDKRTVSTTEKSVNKAKQRDVIELIKQNGVPYIDKRDKGGALWIIGGKELAGFVSECKKYGYVFKFKAGGGKASKGKDSWWIRGN